MTIAKKIQAFPCSLVALFGFACLIRFQCPCRPCRACLNRAKINPLVSLGVETFGESIAIFLVVYCQQSPSSSSAGSTDCLDQRGMGLRSSRKVRQIME